MLLARNSNALLLINNAFSDTKYDQQNKRVAKGFYVTRDSPQSSSVMRDGAQISRVMRDWTSQRDA